MDTRKERAHWPGDAWPECWPGGKAPKPRPERRSVYDDRIVAALREHGPLSQRQLADTFGVGHSVVRDPMMRLLAGRRIAVVGWAVVPGSTRPSRLLGVAA